jgi:hypothetical protein
VGTLIIALLFSASLALGNDWPKPDFRYHQQSLDFSSPFHSLVNELIYTYAQEANLDKEQSEKKIHQILATLTNPIALEESSWQQQSKVLWELLFQQGNQDIPLVRALKRTLVDDAAYFHILLETMQEVLPQIPEDTLRYAIIENTTAYNNQKRTKLGLIMDHSDVSAYSLYRSPLWVQEAAYTHMAQLSVWFTPGMQLTVSDYGMDVFLFEQKQKILGKEIDYENYKTFIRQDFKRIRENSRRKWYEFYHKVRETFPDIYPEYTMTQKAVDDYNRVFTARRDSDKFHMLNQNFSLRQTRYIQLKEDKKLAHYLMDNSKVKKPEYYKTIAIEYYGYELETLILLSKLASYGEIRETQLKENYLSAFIKSFSEQEHYLLARVIMSFAQPEVKDEFFSMIKRKISSMRVFIDLLEDEDLGADIVKREFSLEKISKMKTILNFIEEKPWQNNCQGNFQI